MKKVYGGFGFNNRLVESSRSCLKDQIEGRLGSATKL